MPNLPPPLVCNKLRNKCINAWSNHMVWIVFEPWTPRRKANTTIAELKRILPNAVVRYCI